MSEKIKRPVGRPRKDAPATPQQMKTLNNLVKQATGETFDDFYAQMHDENSRRLFAQTLSKRVSQVSELSDALSAQGKYQPIFSEKVLQGMNINPKAASSYEIEKWLLSPQHYDTNLRHLSQYLAYAVGQYNRSIYYLNTIKSYNYTLLPSDSDVEKAIDMDTYWHSYDICLRTLQKLNVKYQIPKIDLQTMFDGASFYYFNETDDDISFLPLPADYCHITSSWSKGFLFAIDLVVFDKMISVPQQIPELSDAYKVFVEKRKALYTGEKLAPYQYYDVPPDKGWCFTFDPIHPDKIPPLSSSMSAALDTLSYRELLKNKMALDLFKVIALKIPMDKDNKQMAITYKLATEITQVIQSLLPENIKVYSSPFDSEPITTDQSDKYDNIVNLGTDTYFSSVGFQKAQFGGGDVRQGSTLNAASSVDFNYASYHMYRQYENCINWILANKTKGYKFQIQMFGNAMNHDKEVEQAVKLLTTCNFGVLNLMATTGLEPFQVKSTLLLEKSLSLKELMEPLVSAYNTKLATDKGGAPTKLDSEKTDAGIQTSDNDSNENRVK